MNRLIIIGNGFDLAHGLPTSYGHFIDDYWNNVIKKLTIDFQYKDELFEAKAFVLQFNHLAKNRWEEVKKYENIFSFLNDYNDTKFFFKNELFRIICNQTSLQNWVDIENIYYDILKEKAKGSHRKFDYPWDVKKLNEELEQVKNLLIIYLNKKVVNEYNFDFCKIKNIDWIKIYNCLKPISIFSNEENVLKLFINSEDVKEIKEHFEKEKKEELVNNLYFLNFNYTPLANIYCELLNKDERIIGRINFIHGSIENNQENKINFGFGDEMDDDYKIIENINDNEYLRNFKSFQYLQNSNYSKLLSYIDSDKFQVLIIGHSCGLSDRTLLNTIFEHNNCRSIKVFYHQKEDGSDNYTEITQNISRHFNKKKLMREKIVNKTLCQPLPQIQLPKKE